MLIADDDLRALVHRTCLYLDDGNWDGYLDLCAADFFYRVFAYSPELRKDMIWMEQDREGMTDLFGNLANHVTRQGDFLRHANVALIDRDGEDARITTTFLVAYTDFDGASRIFAAGRYNDVVDIAGNQPLLRARDVRLDTRDLGGGTHFPI